MEHILDNPIWNGLISGNRHLGEGNEQVKFFPVDISTFAGLADFSEQNYLLLHDLMQSQSVRATFTPYEMKVPAPFRLAGGLNILQMIHEGDPGASGGDTTITPLHTVDVPAMLALTKLTNPGPFNPRTIEFGSFHGIFKDTELVAMAGQRLKVFRFTEISAVCTHPNHLGKGYARRLLLHQINLIKQSGQIPMLHVKSDNIAAIKLYESVGFSIRRDLNVVIFKKE